jgi:hypothetical protein
VYDLGPKISFGALKTELKALIWPNGVPENLVSPIDKSFEDAFIDIQRYVTCLQSWHVDVFAQCATYFQCGLTVFDKPRGKIRRVRTFQGDFCDPVTLTPATIEQIYCWSRKFLERVTPPANIGMPELPMGFRFADATTDSPFGRAIVGQYSWDRERMYVAPWIQSLESVVVEWDGLKRKFADTDLFPDEQDLKRTIKLYVQAEFSRDFERDFAGKKEFQQAFADARADLIYDCDQENRLPKAESCPAEREYLWFHRLEDNNPETAEVPVVVAAFGDYGSGDDNERAVATLVKSWNPAGVVTLGDNNYPDNGGLTYDQAVGAFYRKFMYPYPGSEPLWAGETDATANMFWPALGNHDIDRLAEYLAYFSGLTPSNDRFYDIVIGPIHFFILNDGINTAMDPTTEPAGNDALSTQASWFRNRVATSLSPWKAAVVHHPAKASPYAHEPLPVLDWVKGVDIVMNGHEHHYERLSVDDQNYAICGAGGAALVPYGPTIAPGSLVRYDASFGAIKLTATCTTLTLEFFNVAGSIIDTLALTK